MTLSSPSSLSVPSIAFFGRTFAEYLAMFALTPDDLASSRIADVGAGPASFTVEARVAGIDAVAVDPMYGLNTAAISSHVSADYHRMERAMNERPELFGPGYHATMTAAFASRRLAADRFLADYEHGFAQGRYVGGALPRLPFSADRFDLVLCAHLLFLYNRHFDFEWHFAACRELVRVARSEVRITPLCVLDGEPYPALPELLARLQEVGIVGAVVPTDYRFFRGAGQMLVLRRRVEPVDPTGFSSATGGDHRFHPAN